VSLSFVELGQVADINPRLPRDTDETQKVSFLAMASVSENGEILNQEERILSETKKGFTYFERNDVLLAKITPCFENGKAVLVDKLNHQIGFGSTEFCRVCIAYLSQSLPIGRALERYAVRTLQF
jgi:type I restriction enzyme S subunit